MRIGVYYVEEVGYVTGLANAEEITASFTGKKPVFVEWETLGDGEE